MQRAGRIHELYIHRQRDTVDAKRCAGANPSFPLALTIIRRNSRKNRPAPSKNVAM